MTTITSAARGVDLDHLKQVDAFIAAAMEEKQIPGAVLLDPVNDCYFVLLANRVHPAGKTDPRPLRTRVATVIGEALLGKAPATGPAVS